MASRQRLLIVLPHLGVGGAQRVAVNLANHWVQEGHVVKLLTTLEHKTDFYQLDERIERLVLAKPPRPQVGLQDQPSALSTYLERWLRYQLSTLQAARSIPPVAPFPRRPQGKALTAARDFIRSRQPLPHSLNALLHLTHRVTQGWSQPRQSFGLQRKSTTPLKLTLSALFLVQSAVNVSRAGRTVLRHARISVGRFGQRAAATGLNFSQVAKHPTLLARFLRVSLWRVGALRETLQSVKPDVVLSFLGATNIITIAAGYGLPYRIVISERNDPSRQALEPPWQNLRPHTYPLADLITANSHGAIQELAVYCAAAKLAYVANPIAVTCVPSDANRAASILFLARLVQQKAPDVLVDAFAEFSREHPEWSLDIAGDGPMEPELRERVSILGIETKVIFHGMVKDPTDLLTRSRVFALPSRFEGTPNSLLEAMASGLACVVSDASPGPLRLVEHEKSGLVVKTDDPRALAGAFSRLANDPCFQKELALAARERTRAFLIDSVAREWERLLFPDDNPLSTRSHQL